MVGIKDMKRRRKSIENTMKITKAMELVAFSKLRKSKEQVLKTEPFFDRIYEVINNISCMNPNIESVFFNKNKNKIKKRCYIIIAGDKGLAGNYNGNILRFALNELVKYDKNDVFIVAIGKKSIGYFKKRDYNLYRQYSDISERWDIELFSNIANQIIDGYVKNLYQEVYFIFTDFISVLVQKPSIKKILPLNFDNKSEQKKGEYIIYDPSPQSVFEKIVPYYLTSMIYGATVQSFASEQAARRMAMESASKNAKDMLHDIDVVFNKKRQSQITQEITEIVSGASTI